MREENSLVPWKLTSKAIQGIKLGGLARRPMGKVGGEDGGDAKETGAGRVHVVTVESSEVLFIPVQNAESGVKKRCEVRDNQGAGSPSSLVFDAEQALFVADFAKKAILSQRPTSSEEEERYDEFDVLVSDYEGKPFCGPNSLAFDDEGNLFFTDSGPMGETSLEKPKGSVFVVEQTNLLLKPLALECMAHPSGIAVSPDGRIVYVAETMANRIVRFVKQRHGVFLSSVFHQFSGGFGPTALSLVSDGRASYLLVARFDFSAPQPSTAGSPRDAPEQAMKAGILAVLKESGEVMATHEGPPGTRIYLLY